MIKAVWNYDNSCCNNDWEFKLIIILDAILIHRDKGSAIKLVKN